MTTAMTRMRPERRPNTGRTAVLTQDQATPVRWRYVRSQLANVEGQRGHRLHHEAATAFTEMAQMAEYDDVALVILASYRTPETATHNAVRTDNASSTARFSSHSLGLAVDLRMGDEHHHYQEITTHPMQNVADMRMSTAHKWMVLRGAGFGWFPFGDEPWHWEYNPPGFWQRFWADGSTIAPRNGRQLDGGTPGQ